MTSFQQELRDRAASLTHVGFTGHEYEAVQTFFSYYGLEFPSTPLLHSEYRNPLYLKTRLRSAESQRGRPGCRGESRESRPPSISIGASSTVNWPESLDYNPADNLVKLAVGAFAVTVQQCGDLGTIRPLVEGQPSTESPLQTVSVPSNVNSYPLPKSSPNPGMAGWLVDRAERGVEPVSSREAVREFSLSWARHLRVSW